MKFSAPIAQLDRALAYGVPRFILDFVPSETRDSVKEESEGRS